MKRSFISTSYFHNFHSPVSSFTKVGSLEKDSCMVLSSPKDDFELEERPKKNLDQSITSIEVASMSSYDSYTLVSNH